MTLNELCARFDVIDSLNAAKMAGMAKYVLIMTPTPCIESFAFVSPKIINALHE